MMENRKIRVLLVTNIIAPYRVPVWKALSGRSDDFLVILLAKKEGNRVWEVDNLEGLPYKTLASRAKYLAKIDDYLYFGGKIIREIHSYRPTHIILDGYHQPSFIKTILYARFYRIPSIQWFESHAESSSYRSGLIHWLRSRLLRLSDSWIVPGILSREYLEDMGIPAQSIVIAPNAVETLIFSNSEIPANRKRARFLYAGRYTQYKGVNILIDAFKRLSGEKSMLRLVGHGPMEEELKEMISGIPNIEMMPAARTPAQMSAHYAWADILAFPTLRDPWGLVVNEALASGCYVLSSKLAGATPDLIVDAPYEVGKVIHPEVGAEGLSIELETSCNRIEEIRSARDRRKAWGRTFTPELCSERILQAIKLADEKYS